MGRRIVLIGANGQLGTDLQKVLPKEELIPLTHAELDITHFEEMRTKLTRLAPTHVINTAAYHRVDECETNDQQAFLVNSLAPKELALHCKQLGSILVHLSTDYVFNGEKKSPYVEGDLPKPQSVYALSKYMGELYIQAYGEKYFIIRSCGLYGVSGCRASGGLNFPELMLKLAKERGEVSVVTDQIVTPTYTLHLARKIAELLETEVYGLYHMSSQGACSWYEFAQQIFTLTKTPVQLKSTTSEAFKSRAKRPAYSVLENHRLRQLSLSDLPPWEEALKDYLEERATFQ